MLARYADLGSVPARPVPLLSLAALEQEAGERTKLGRATAATIMTRATGMLLPEHDTPASAQAGG